VRDEAGLEVAVVFVRLHNYNALARRLPRVRPAVEPPAPWEGAAQPRKQRVRASCACILRSSSLVLPANMGPRMTSMRPATAGAGALQGASSPTSAAKGASCAAAAAAHA